MKLLRKLSLQTQIILINTILLFSSIGFYFLYLWLMSNTALYSNHPNLCHIVFWLVAVVVIAILDSYFIENITFPANKFIGYAKEFDKINFKEIEAKMTNSDFIKLANAFDNLQSQLFSTINELQIKNNEITKLNDEMKQDLVNKRNLVSAISHDIKTPLTIIQATISGIKDGVFTESEIPNELDNILYEINKTTKMLQDTINIYKIEAELADKNTYVNIELRDLISEICVDFKTLFEKHNQTLSLDFSTNIYFMGDAIKMKKALSNIILNAIIYSPDNNSVIINVKSDGNNKVLEVINTGITIPEDEIKHIFEPFYRVDKSRTYSEDYGNGLGLFLTQEILKKHHLTLEVANLDDAVKFSIKF